MSRSTAARTAWLVHAYTGLGLVCGYFAYTALLREDARVFFLWLAASVFIDSTDGVLVRRFRVGEVLPEFDGRRLDDIIDYLTYVLLPMLAAAHWGLLPGGLEWLVLLPLAASGYGFSQAGAKTEDSFVGFPSYWNVVVFYAAALRWPTGMNALLFVGLSLLVFIPIHFVYPSRARWLQKPTLALAGLWGGLILAATFRFGTEPGYWAAVFSLFFPAYYSVISLMHDRRVRGRSRPGDSELPGAPPETTP